MEEDEGGGVRQKEEITHGRGREKERENFLCELAHVASETNKLHYMASTGEEREKGKGQ